MTKPPLPVEDFGSINISDNGHDGEVLIIEEDLEVAEKFEPESCLRKAQEELEDEFAAERFIRASASPPCGLRERTLLCPIQVMILLDKSDLEGTSAIFRTLAVGGRHRVHGVRLQLKLGRTFG